MSTQRTLRGRIVIGDDPLSLSSEARATLEERGFSVGHAADGRQALKMAREGAADLVVLDIDDPKIQGIDVLKAMRADIRTERIGVLICAGKDEQTGIDKCHAIGVQDVLLKPFEAEEFIERVEGFFSRRSRAAAALGTANPATVRTVGAPFLPTLDKSLGCFSLWGTRGSTPTPGARFLRHGGNTSCMSVVSGGEQFIFDAGTGIRELGLELMGKGGGKLHLFITHTHWDHIQGFPFFTPAYVPGFELTIYGAEGFGKDLKSVFRGQLDREYFPVQMEDMNSQIVFKHLADNPVIIGDARVSWEYAQHPGATVGYKIAVPGKTIAWVPDNEFLKGYTGSPAELTPDDPIVAPYRRMIDFLSDADVVVHEAQYTTQEYLEKIRWGHSSIANAALLMKLAGVKRWIITHHDPMHDDNFLEWKLNLTRRILEDIGHPIPVSHGYDGMTEHF
jgi:phosphoribosyl 1,2-cyclic phosphodiesterase/ActR/RegA family two-component response regulator